MQYVVGPGALVQLGVFASTMEVTLEGGATLLGGVLENIKNVPELLQCESACWETRRDTYTLCLLNYNASMEEPKWVECQMDRR